VPDVNRVQNRSAIVSEYVSWARGKSKLMTMGEGTAQSKQLKRPTIWQLALPSIAANLMFSMVAMVQTKFVGG
jgi:Na+-driven multidrug efflux pump